MRERIPLGIGRVEFTISFFNSEKALGKNWTVEKGNAIIKPQKRLKTAVKRASQYLRGSLLREGVLDGNSPDRFYDEVKT